MNAILALFAESVVTDPAQCESSIKDQFEDGAITDSSVFLSVVCSTESVEITLRVLRPYSSLTANSISILNMQNIVTHALVATLKIDPARIQWLPNAMIGALSCVFPI